MQVLVNAFTRALKVRGARACLGCRALANVSARALKVCLSSTRGGRARVAVTT